MGAFPSHQSADICKLSVKGDDDASHKELVQPAGGLGDCTPRRQWVDAHSALPFTQGGAQAPPKEEEIFFNWWKIALQHCVGFCHAATWISHNYTSISSLLSFLSFPPSHLSRLSQNRRLDSMCYAATFHPPSISHMIIYGCHCYFLNLSHPHSPPLCPQVSSLLGSLVPFIYIPCICIDIWYLLSFWLTSLCIRF